MPKKLSILLLISKLSFADPFPCPVYSYDEKHMNRIPVVAFINHVWATTRFDVYPDPDTEYTVFNDFKVIGFIEPSCKKDLK